MTDIEGSTLLLADLGPDYARLLLDHHAIVRGELSRHSGVEVSTEGDSFFIVFGSAVDAVRTAVGVQRCLAAHAWPGGREVRVRIGIHTGEGTTAGEGYVGMDVHRVARVSAAGHGGQVLLTAATQALLEGHWPDGTSAVPLGAHRLKDLPAPETLYQLVADGLATRFPPLRSLEAPVYDLPTASAPILGRDDDAARVAELLTQHRLVTLTGPGGVGKTRLALHLSDFATIAALEGDEERALRLAGALDQLKRLTGTDLVDHPVNAIPHLREILAGRGADGERLLAEGGAMSVAEVVRYALQEVSP